MKYETATKAQIAMGVLAGALLPLAIWGLTSNVWWGVLTLAIIAFCAAVG